MNKQNKVLVMTACVSLSIGAIMPVVAYELGQNESERMTNNVPRVIPFTGQYSKSGQLHTGQVPMSFRLYDSTTSNVAVWIGSDRMVDVKDGVFSVILGDGNDANVIPLDTFEQPALYLEIVVQGTGLTPRQRIAPSPQAVYSATAAQAKYTVRQIGNEQTTTNGIYCGETPSTTGKVQVSTPNGSLIGLRAAKGLCEMSCGVPTAHMCTSNEMNISAQMGALPTASRTWVLGGALTFHVPSQGVDNQNFNCGGFTDTDGTRFGLVDGTMKGAVFHKFDANSYFINDNDCALSRPIACCN